jgi:FkbM family methyltransferase
MYITSILRDIQDINIFNPLYAYLDFFPPYSENIVFAHDIQHIKTFYDNSDFYTTKIIESAIYMRSTNICRIQSIETAINFSGSENYWCDEDMPSLNAYDNITFCDCGAFCGDTLKILYRRYGTKIKKYFGFEPDLKSYQELQKTVKSLKMDKFAFLYQIGLGNANGRVDLISGEFNSNSHFANVIASTVHDNKYTNVSIKCLDDIDIAVNGKLCVKMDIEGFEMDALLGAKKIIKKYEPDLAICVYHKASDLLEIPKYIKSLNADYNCILRGGTHMICFAHCEKD